MNNGSISIFPGLATFLILIAMIANKLFTHVCNNSPVRAVSNGEGRTIPVTDKDARSWH
jgi:hypothetical protein